MSQSDTLLHVAPDHATFTRSQRFEYRQAMELSRPTWKPLADQQSSLDTRARERPLAIIEATGADLGTFALALPNWTVVPLSDYSRLHGDHKREIHVVIIDHPSSAEDEIHASIGRARAAVPDAPIALYVRMDNVSTRTVFKASLWNVAGVLFADELDEPDLALRAVLSARAVWRGREIAVTLPPLTPAWLRQLLQRAVAHGHLNLACPALARMCELGLRTLDRKLQALGLPSVEYWITHGRILCALDAFACGLRLIQDAGRDVGYADPASLRRAAKKHLGCSITAAANAGGVAYAARLLSEKIETGLTREREREREEKIARED